MNLAHSNVSPIRPDLRAVEPRVVVDTDNGYTRIANELLEAIASADLTARQLKLMLAYVRKTYGFNKKTDRIADEQVAQLTGLSRQNVNKAKKELLSMKCLLMEGNQIGVNKEISAWQFSKCLQVSNFVSNPETKKVSKLETVEVSSLETHKRHSLKTKENKPPKSPRGESVKFDPYSIPVPEWLNQQAWYEWIEYRKETKKPIKTERTVTKAFGVLKDCFDSGHDPVDIINRSIANGYQGLFKPNYPAPKPIPVQQEIQPQSDDHWNSRKAWEEKFI